MEKDPLAMATRLLVKAQGTTFDAEAAALTAKAYRLLAEALNAYDDRSAPAGAVRKRERRHLRDRRSLPATGASTPSRVTEPSPFNVRQSTWIHQPTTGHVDLRI
jgi:anti-sigma factor RsiW